jgi:predicted nuclease with TOPRIM domain
MAEKLKREFIELLETDKEFRYTVAGYLGLSEVLRRMDRMEERMLALEERMLKLEERMLRVEENQERLWEAVKRLEENQERLWEAVKRLEENQRKLWEAVKGLEEGQNKLWRYVKSGFKELREMLGVTFEATARAFIDVLLDEMGYPEASVSVKHFAVDGEVVEVDAFCEDPLVVGEITDYIKSRDEAESEVEKLRSRISLVERRYGRRVMLAVLVVATASEEVSSHLREVAGRNGILVVLGREIREKLEA